MCVSARRERRGETFAISRRAEITISNFARLSLSRRGRGVKSSPLLLGLLRREDREARCGDLSRPAASRLHAAEYRRQSRRRVTHPFGNYSPRGPDEASSSSSYSSSSLFRSFRSVPLGEARRYALSIIQRSRDRRTVFLNPYPADLCFYFCNENKKADGFILLAERRAERLSRESLPEVPRIKLSPATSIFPLGKCLPVFVLRYKLMLSADDNR